MYTSKWKGEIKYAIYVNRIKLNDPKIFLCAFATADPLSVADLIRAALLRAGTLISLFVLSTFWNTLSRDLLFVCTAPADSTGADLIGSALQDTDFIDLFFSRFAATYASGVHMEPLSESATDDGWRIVRGTLMGNYRWGTGSEPM